MGVLSFTAGVDTRMEVMNMDRPEVAIAILCLFCVAFGYLWGKGKL